MMVAYASAQPRPLGMVAVLEGDEGSVKESHVTSLVQLRLCLGV